MNLDDRYIYVFVRQDVPIPQQLVNASHAAYHVAALCRLGEGVPSLVAIGVPHAKAMSKVLAKLRDSQLAHFAWTDPDFSDLGVTSVATSPLSDQQRAALRNYRLYSLGAEKPACGLTADEGANAAVAQLREHSVSNGEVAGANPASGSMNCS